MKPDLHALNHCVTHTNCEGIPLYRGKVRDVYTLSQNRIGIVASDRISAFDHILRQAIPFKGQILNTLSKFFFDHVKDLVNTHILEVPHPNITIGRKCVPIPVEVVIRNVLVGHSWRVYKSGGRELCGVSLPDGLAEYSIFDAPMLTPATKAQEGHDEDISELEILEQKLVPEHTWQKIRETAFKLFNRGQEMADERGLILADTKYEFGIFEGELYLIDEVHTPDSSRYFEKEGYHEQLANGERPSQLSKEFVREWLMGNNFQGLEGQVLPDLPDEFRWEVYERYRGLYERLTGTSFHPVPTADFNRQVCEILSEA